MNKPRLRLHVRNHTGMTVSIQEASRSREFKPIPTTRGPVISQPPHPGTSIVTPRQHVARDQITGRHLHVKPRTITRPRVAITLQPRGQPFHPQRNRRTIPPQLTVRLTVETRKLINHQDTVSFAIDPIDCTCRPRSNRGRHDHSQERLTTPKPCGHRQAHTSRRHHCPTRAHPTCTHADSRNRHQPQRNHPRQNKPEYPAKETRKRRNPDCHDATHPKTRQSPPKRHPTTGPDPRPPNGRRHQRRRQARQQEKHYEPYRT